MKQLQGYASIALGVALVLYLVAHLSELSFGLETLSRGHRNRSGYAMLFFLGVGGIAAILYGLFHLASLKPRKVDPEIQKMLDSLDE